MEQRIVTLNIGGRLFQTYRDTLNNIPNTTLANLSERDNNYDAISDVYFFDRNPELFASILDFYRQGELHFEHCRCGPAVKMELDYWGIDENCISSCCWKSYSQYKEDRRTIDRLEKVLYEEEVDISGQKDRPAHRHRTPHVTTLPGSTPPRRPSSTASFLHAAHSGCSTCKSSVWNFLDRPYSSRGAQVWALMIFVLILVSIIIVVVETHPWFRVPRDADDNNATTAAQRSDYNLTAANEKLRMFKETQLHPALEYMDGVCVSVFTVELVLRLATSPSKLKFIKGGYNIIDIFCVLPLAIYYIGNAIDSSIFLSLLFGNEDTIVIVMIYISLSCVLRVFRLFKLARHYRALKILHLAVGSSLKELSLLLLLISMGTLIFSTLIYYAEFQNQGKFTNIPIGFWWSTITMTTVGYGDMYPEGAWGCIVGIVCAISGMLITGLPIPIIANNFNHYYTYARLTTQITEKLRKEKKVWKGKSAAGGSRPTVNNGSPAAAGTSRAGGANTRGSTTPRAVPSRLPRASTLSRNNKVTDCSLFTYQFSDTLPKVGE